MRYYDTAGGGEQHDEYHRSLPDPLPHPQQPVPEQPQTRRVHQGLVLPSAKSGGGRWTPPPEQEAATQMLPPYPAFQPPAAPPVPGAGWEEGAGADADATQLLPPQAPVPVQDEGTTALRQPASGQVPGAAPAGATQPMPRFEEPAAPMAQPGYGPAPSMPQGAFDHLYRQGGPPQQPMFQQYEYEAQPPRKGLSRGALIGVVVAGCAVVGLVAGAVLSSGEDSDTAVTTSAKTSAAAGGSPSAGVSEHGADPAKQQAQQLDALLRRSGSSRSAVVQAVADIKVCQNLDGAAADLRSAADQREALVTRLGQLTIDKLPGHAALSAALNRAWTASAAADDHYAAWADQMAGKKGCRHGQTRFTGQTAQGNVQSGAATLAKKAAVHLWNSIADEYGLTQRTYTQL